MTNCNLRNINNLRKYLIEFFTMTKSIIIVLMLTCSNNIFSQDSIAGVYFYSFFDVSHRLNLLPSNKSVRTIYSMAGTIKILGNWSIKDDTIIIIEELAFSPIDSVKKISDTLILKTINRYYAHP